MSLGTHRIDLPCEGDEQALIWGHTVEVSRLSRRGKVFAPAVSIKYGHCKFLNLGVHLSSRTKCNITKDLWVRGDAMIHHEEMTSCTHQAPASRGRHTLFLSVILCYPVGSNPNVIRESGTKRKATTCTTCLGAVSSVPRWIRLFCPTHGNESVARGLQTLLHGDYPSVR